MPPWLYRAPAAARRDRGALGHTACLGGPKIQGAYRLRSGTRPALLRRRMVVDTDLWIRSLLTRERVQQLTGSDHVYTVAFKPRRKVAGHRQRGQDGEAVAAGSHSRRRDELIRAPSQVSQAAGTASAIPVLADQIGAVARCPTGQALPPLRAGLLGLRHGEDRRRLPLLFEVSSRDARVLSLAALLVLASDPPFPAHSITLRWRIWPTFSWTRGPAASRRAARATGERTRHSATWRATSSVAL